MGGLQPRVLAIAAMASEAEPVRRRLAGAQAIRIGPCPSWQGLFAGCHLTLLLCGIGPAAASAAVRAALSFPGAAGTSLTLSFGVAGALRSGVPVAEAFVCAPLLAPEGLPLWPGAALLERAHLPAAACVTLPAVAASPVEKAALHTKYRADLVDMESYAIAQVCAGAGLPWLALRTALDGPEDDFSALPPADRAGPLDYVRFAAVRPRLALRLRRDLARCAANLAEALARICAGWAADFRRPPAPSI